MLNKFFSALLLVWGAHAQSEEENPNCTTGNAEACNNANGFWDYNECTCTFAPSIDGDQAPADGEYGEEWEGNEDWEDWEDYYGEHDDWYYSEDYEHLYELMYDYDEIEESWTRQGWTTLGNMIGTAMISGETYSKDGYRKSYHYDDEDDDDYERKKGYKMT